MGASPNDLDLEGGKTTIATEDDVLHIRTLPNFDGTVGQASRTEEDALLHFEYFRVCILSTQ